MTSGGYERLEQELKRLKYDERPAVIKAIAEAREHGDLSENAEYHAARERQSFIEGRLLELEDKLARAEIIDISQQGGSTVKFGAQVKLVDEETEEEVVYQVVGPDEAEIQRGLLSISAPLGRALIGREAGDTVEVPTPRGTRYFEILEVAYPGEIRAQVAPAAGRATGRPAPGCWPTTGRATPTRRWRWPRRWAGRSRHQGASATARSPGCPTALLGASLRGLTAAARAGLAPPWPELVIAAGRRTAPVARWLKRRRAGGVPGPADVARLGARARPDRGAGARRVAAGGRR